MIRAMHSIHVYFLQSCTCESKNIYTVVKIGIIIMPKIKLHKCSNRNKKNRGKNKSAGLSRVDWLK